MLGITHNTPHSLWHHVSRERLPKYANEFAFRWNHRRATDGERVVAIKAIEGKRLTYKPRISLRKQPKQEEGKPQISKKICRMPTQL